MQPRFQRDPEYATWWLRIWGDPIDHPELARCAQVDAFRAEIAARDRVPELRGLLERHKSELEAFWLEPAEGETTSLSERGPAAVLGRFHGALPGSFEWLAYLVRSRCAMLDVHIAQLRLLESDPRLLRVPRRGGRAPELAFNLACAAIADWLEERGGSGRAGLWPAVAGCLDFWGSALAHVHRENRPAVCRQAAQRWRDVEPGLRAENEARVRDEENRRRIRAAQDALDEAEGALGWDEESRTNP